MKIITIYENIKILSRNVIIKQRFAWVENYALHSSSICNVCLSASEYHNNK